MNYREDLIRIPILCHLQSASDQEAFLHSIKNGREHLTQDISFQMEDRYILIFKTLKGEHLFSDYKFFACRLFEKYVEMDAGRRDLLYILRWNLSDQLFSVLLFVSALQMAGNSHFWRTSGVFIFMIL